MTPRSCSRCRAGPRRDQPDDGTFNQITIIEVLDGGIDCLDEVLFGADVVDGDLGDFVIVLCH